MWKCAATGMMQSTKRRALWDRIKHEYEHDMSEDEEESEWIRGSTGSVGSFRRLPERR